MITILGPTATGKTSVAAALARRIGGEIISADSRQVYRRMDIGTGKDLRDYGSISSSESSAEAFVPYHLIDICEPGTVYNVYQFQQDFWHAYHDITSRGKEVILCGGTGLYIESVLKGYTFNPPAADSPSEPSHFAPIEEDGPIFGIMVPREVRRERITRRLYERLNEGMVAEIQALLDEGVSAEQLIRYGLEYKFVTQYLLGQLSYDEMVTLLETAIHQFAKRQMTWFRGMEERRNTHIHWIDGLLPLDQKIEQMLTLINSSH